MVKKTIIAITLLGMTSCITTEQYVAERNLPEYANCKCPAKVKHKNPHWCSNHPCCNKIGVMDVIDITGTILLIKKINKR